MPIIFNGIHPRPPTSSISSKFNLSTPAARIDYPSRLPEALLVRLAALLFVALDFACDTVLMLLLQLLLLLSLLPELEAGHPMVVPALAAVGVVMVVVVVLLTVRTTLTSAGAMFSGSPLRLITAISTSTPCNWWATACNENHREKHTEVYATKTAVSVFAICEFP